MNHHRSAGKEYVATKEHKRQAQGVIGALEFRVHSGPPIHDNELHAAREFLRQHDFPPASDYFRRLAQIQDRMRGRSLDKAPQTKRNYGGEAAGFRMQLQCIYDHVIFSTCYDGEFRARRGRVKISHRFNQEGRIDFIELKYLRSLHPLLDGEIRKLVLLKDYQCVPKGWHQAEAFVLQALPQELIFLYEDIFRCPRIDIVAWLVNIGHGMVGDLVKDLETRRPARRTPEDTCLLEVHSSSPQLQWVSNPLHCNGFEFHSPFANGEDGNAVGAHNSNGQDIASLDGLNGKRPAQLPLEQIISDDVGMPILRKVAGLECAAEELDAKTVLLRYVRTNPA